MKTEHINFWLELLKLGRNENERAFYWNYYLFQHFRDLISSNVNDVELQSIRSQLSLPNNFPSQSRFQNALNHFLENHEHNNSFLPHTTPSDTSTSLLDFSDFNFPGEITFSGRLLIGANFTNATFGERVIFNDARFVGPTAFNRANFKFDRDPDDNTPQRGVSFLGSSFHGPVSFGNTKFPCTSSFEGTTFKGQAIFEGAEFRGSLKFDGAEFHPAEPPEKVASQQCVSFSGTTFRGSASFDNTKFPAKSSFEGTTFLGKTTFDRAEFQGHVNFDDANFLLPELPEDVASQRNVSFLGTSFRGLPSFSNTRFDCTSCFERATFKTGTVFQNTEFLGPTNFNEAAFLSTDLLESEEASQQGASFLGSVFQSSACFSNTEFCCSISFEETTFKNVTVFDDAMFHGPAKFDHADICTTEPLNKEATPMGVSFSGATFQGPVSFSSTKFPYTSSFEGTGFKNLIGFDDALFRGAARFDNANFQAAGPPDDEAVQQIVSFSGSIFRGPVSFTNTRFPDNSSFSRASFGKHTTFDRAEFSGVTRFDGADFQAIDPSGENNAKTEISFSGTAFIALVSFTNAKFPYTSNFEGTVFSKQANFDGAEFRGPANFKGMKFDASQRHIGEPPQQEVTFVSSIFHGTASFPHIEFPYSSSFDSAVFEEHATFDGATFRGPASFCGTDFRATGLSPQETLEYPILSFSGSKFCGRTNFTNAKFPRTCSFENSEFREQAIFDNADFVDSWNSDAATYQTTEFPTQEMSGQTVSFSGSAFQKLASFDGTKLPCMSNFGSVVFQQDVRFLGSIFPARFVKRDVNRCQASFKASQFLGLADFEDAYCGADLEFDNAEVSGVANFRRTTFRGTVRFHNCKFRSTTSFRDAVFWKPPYFFGTQLHEDVNFTGANWDQAEESYRRSIGRDELENTVSVHADDAVRSWDRLALIMSQREKLPERHVFFRLKMRAVRRRDGFGLLSILNLVFDLTSDYGWSVGRALMCWAGQILFFGVFLSGMTSNCSWGSAFGWRHDPRILLEGLFLSFSNSHAFLRLASGDGWLQVSRMAIEGPCEASSISNYIGYIGFAQAVVGPILLFLVLLTLRNRFRLG